MNVVEECFGTSVWSFDIDGDGIFDGNDDVNGDGILDVLMLETLFEIEELVDIVLFVDVLLINFGMLSTLD